MATFLTGFANNWSAYENPVTPATQNLQYGGFIQDNWHVNDRLTLNLGVRYDLEAGFYSEYVKLEPFLPGNLPHDKNNVAPRLGFAYQINDRTVIRGGGGRFTQASFDTGGQNGFSRSTTLITTRPIRYPKTSCRKVKSVA